MFAYVRYVDDNIRQIVPLDHIKGFCPKDVKDFETKKKYNILWKKSAEDQGQYYKAQILKLAGRYLKLHYIYKYISQTICCTAGIIDVGITVTVTKDSQTTT